ncbi:MAG TPA: putative toxin-antitoxin system toxin component, PIN family [Candidatus Elarobacter sp.]|jgi:putative PIN family toxin of toxin-antitoxin system|nr:putative toxin-antitoxin system toxin component, PIN family [Candidatus Elarobacter sp.]
MSRPQPSAVIDPSVLVSAAIAIDAGRASASRLLVEDALIRRGAFVNFTSAPLLYELGDVLARVAIPFAAANITEFVSLIALASTTVESVQGVVMGCRDPRDDKVLECAMNAPAQYIVTRDKDLLEASPGEKYAVEKTGPGIRGEPIRVVTVEQFTFGVLEYDRTREPR